MAVDHRQLVSRTGTSWLQRGRRDGIKLKSSDEARAVSLLRMSWEKRVVDLVSALVGLLLLSPLLVTVAIAILADDGRPVFFRQARIGHRGTTFRIWKFRTMCVNAEAQGRRITVGDDPRITRVGRVLRQLKIDELPQLINVVKGEMSLVGPRPEVPEYVARYTPEQRNVLSIIPGITDPASIEYRREGDILACAHAPERTYVEVIMPEKIRLNLEYAKSATVWTDLRVIAGTIWLILKDRGAGPSVSS